VVERIADAAERARRAELDGIELHSANGYLFTQFLSSAINDRRDRYGGSLENRARFLLEVIEAIQKRVGRDFPLIVKLTSRDEHNAVGFLPRTPGQRRRTLSGGPLGGNSGVHPATSRWTTTSRIRSIRQTAAGEAAAFPTHADQQRDEDLPHLATATG
jgi:2,4-dienoyl-CoA reductase-like NADH-dependent reductase (Old Yellow Enzyme family)